VKKINMKNIVWLIIIMIAVTMGPMVALSSAREWKGVNFSDEMQVDGTALVLNGLGLRQATSFKVNIYVAGLYLAEKSSDSNIILQSTTPKRLVLHFLRNLGSKDLTKAWDDGFANNVANQIPVLRERIEKIKSFTKDMKTGQELIFTYKPGTGIEVGIDSAVVGTVEGDDFAKAFLSIWLGPNPPNQNLKDGILGASTL
jgi:hypothetical protein